MLTSVESDGQTIEVVRIREPVIADFEIANKEKNTTNGSICMLSLVLNLSTDSFRGMGARDTGHPSQLVTALF